MLKKYFLRSEFARNFFILLTGTTIAQTIPVLIQPVLRRIYSPEDFGVFAVYLSITGILTVIATFRYEMAIVLPEHDRDASNVLGLSVIINLSFSLLLAVGIFCFIDKIIVLLDLPAKYSIWIYIIPLSVFLFSSYQSINYWLIRMKAFKASSFNKISRRTIEGSVQLLLGTAKSSSGLFVGDIMGRIVLTITGIYQLFKTNFALNNITKKGIKSAMKRYSEFPKFSAFPALLNTASFFLPVLFINRFFSNSITGYYDLCMQVLALPLALISTSISQVLFQRISAKRNTGQPILKEIVNLSLVLFSLSLIGVLFIILLGSELFEFVFGDGWSLSGRFAKILVFSYAIKFVVSPLSTVFIALERIKLGGIWQVSYFCAVCILILFQDLDIYDFLKIYVAIDIIAYLVYFVLMIKVVRDYENK